MCQARQGIQQPHLILLDLGLPKMSGIDFLRRIRADGRTQDIPIVVLSLSKHNYDVSACIQQGAEAYIVKPVNFDDFFRVTAGLKLRLKLVPRPGAGQAGGWILSSACTVPHLRLPRGGATAAAKPNSP